MAITKKLSVVRSFLFGIGLGLLSFNSALAQDSYVWTELTSAPFVNRYNDVHFENEDIGWITHGDGDIYRTLDGGSSWTLQYRNLNAHFRSIVFLDEMHGFAGNVGPGEFGAVEVTPIFETKNGGQIWLPATGYTSDPPVGICGMQAVNDSTVVGVGRVRGPAVFVRSTDSGATWDTVDMSQHAAGLIDVHFTHPDSGLVVGLSNELHSESSAVILRTTDGGDTWIEEFTSTRTGEWAWKMTFPTRKTGYVSLQRNTESPIYFLKTTDGGSNWEEKLLFDGRYFVQGMGFIDENTGWVGGNSSAPVLMTTDGGETWQEDEIRPRINRIRFLSDTLGYAVGRAAYKIEKVVPTGVEKPIARDERKILRAYPNPFSETVSIDVDSDGSPVTIRIVDVSGRVVRRLVDNFTGSRITWDGTDISGSKVSSGVYFLIAQAGQQTDSQSIILVDQSLR
jgi:photosystem II stability/assembly factor-like uncharacterized protein